MRRPGVAKRPTAGQQEIVQSERNIANMCRGAFYIGDIMACRIWKADLGQASVSLTVWQQFALLAICVYGYVRHSVGWHVAPLHHSCTAEDRLTRSSAPSPTQTKFRMHGKQLPAVSRHPSQLEHPGPGHANCGAPSLQCAQLPRAD